MARIIVVDDDQDILRYCDSILSAQGHEVVALTNAHRALELLSTHGADLLVLDVVMPDMSGFDLLRHAFKLKSFHMPVLMLTGRRAPEDVRTALRLGATDYMVKPLDRDIFLAKVQMLIGLHDAAPEIKFAKGSANADAEVSFPCLLASITEAGVTLRTTNSIERGMRLRVGSQLFPEIGIECPPLRAVWCRQLEPGTDAQYRYEVFVSFIGLDDAAMKKIRRWIAMRTIGTRKAG